MNTSPAIILVTPQMGENIGMAARAMLNCGLEDLRLVRPRDGWPSIQAKATGAGADIVLEKARVFETIEEAIADLSKVFATTARKRDMVTRVIVPRQAGQVFKTLSETQTTFGVLFGGERSGLDNNAIALSDTIIEAPLNPHFSSLNLSQAVLVIAYEWRLTCLNRSREMVLQASDHPLATKDEILGFFNRLTEGLTRGGFFKEPNMEKTMRQNLLTIFQRSDLTPQEVRILHGVISSLMGDHHKKIVP